MRLNPRFVLARLVLEGPILALLIASAGCTKPGTDNGTATGGSSGTSTGGQPGASGGSTGSGGARTTGSGGARTTGTGGSVTTGTGGSPATGTGGSSTTGTGGSTTGGTTGTGGTIVGGTGGAGGAAVVQKLCATKTVVMNPVFLNFENYTGMGTMTAATYSTAFGGTTPNTGTAYAGIYPYPESAGSTTPALSILAGHPPSNWAAGLTVTQASAWGMGGGVWMGCANASAYKGISFWVRGTSGTGTFQFSVSMESTQLPDATNPAGGGTCPGTSDTCKDPSKANIPLTADWTQVQILWADFTPGMSGATSVVPKGDNISGLVWNVPLQYHLDPSVPADAAGPYIPIPGDLLINIDDISFIQ